jgi:hypothetical protein
MIKAFTGLINIQANATTTFCVLGTVAPTATKATWATYNDCKYGTPGNPFEIASVNGYALGGSGIATAVPTIASAVIGIKSTAPTVFTTTGTIAASYAITQYAAASSTTTSNPLMSYHNIGAQSVTNGTLTLTWAAAGIFTNTVAADS